MNYSNTGEYIILTFGLSYFTKVVDPVLDRNAEFKSLIGFY